MALLHVDLFSDALGMCTEMDVILPDNMPRGSKYPTLYLLHGMSGDHTQWQRYTSIERYAMQYELAVVMPSTHLAWYTDMSMGLKYFTYISEELPRICKTFFPGMSAAREDNFVAGLSMGGYGALKCALRCPDTFSYGASLSGAVDLAQMIPLLENPEVMPEALRNIRFWEDIFGPLEDFDKSLDNLMNAARACADEAAQKPRIYLACGLQDTLLPQSHAMESELKSLDFDVTSSYSDGVHDFAYWDDKITDVLSWLPLRKRGC